MNTQKEIIVFKPGTEAQLIREMAEAPGIYGKNFHSSFIYLPNLHMAIQDKNLFPDATKQPYLGISNTATAIQSRHNDHEVHAIFFPQASPQASYKDDKESTWGLKAVEGDTCEYTGQGTKLCILDTGFDPMHRDFKGRTMTAKSFVPNEGPEDGHGHGTHCMGTAGGYKDGNGRQYGLAYKAELLAGKVLSNAGSGQLSWILQGIEWGLENKATVISMSLGNGYPTYDNAYEEAAKRCLLKGTLIVAAAGNHRGQGTVGQPANSPSVLAVGAVDCYEKLARFSCGSGRFPGSNVGVVAPGVEVYSCVPGDKYATWSGTSMATPHVAGLACLISEALEVRGVELLNEILSHSTPIEGISVQDQGAGLVLAP
jgi:subtilisin family serine protease